MANTENITIPSSSSFLSKTKEKQEFNQYWYSDKTIKTFAQEVDDFAEVSKYNTNTSQLFYPQNEITFYSKTIKTLLLLLKQNKLVRK